MASYLNVTRICASDRNGTALWELAVTPFACDSFGPLIRYKDTLYEVFNMVIHEKTLFLELEPAKYLDLSK